MDQPLQLEQHALLCDWLRKRGYGVLINLAALAAVLLVLTLVLSGSVAWAESLSVYKKRFVATCVLLVSLAMIVAGVVHQGGRSANRWLGVVFVATAILAECGAQYAASWQPFRMQFRQPDPYLGFAGTPGLRKVDMNLAEQMGGNAANAVVELNELGYRGPLPSRDKRDEYRVLMLGGSTVFLASPLANSVPGQLESALSRAGVPGVKVYNWGLVSAVSGQELASLSLRAMEFDPDLIVVYDGANDAIAPCLYDPRPGYPYNFFLSEMGQQFAERRFSTAQMLKVLVQKSGAMRIVFGDTLSPEVEHLAALRRQYEYGSADWKTGIAQTYGRNLSKMALACSTTDSKLAVFLQPLITHKESLTGKERAIGISGPLKEHINTVYPAMATFAKKALNDSENKRVYFADMSRVLKDVQGELFWDLIHVNNRGNQIIAAEMASQLLPFIDGHAEARSKVPVSSFASR